MEHFLSNPEFIADADALAKVKRWCRRVSSKSDRKKALDADVIVTTSGMLDGGPAHWYLNRLRHDQRNAILLTGYQAEGSGGRMLLDDNRMHIFGKMVDINLEVDQFSLSNHADHPLLVEFAKKVDADDVILFHGDRKDAQPALSKTLTELGQRVHMPENGHSYILP